MVATRRQSKKQPLADDRGSERKGEEEEREGEERQMEPSRSQELLGAEEEESVLEKMDHEAEKYVQFCLDSGLKVDPSVLTSLQTGWKYIKASNEFSLLPLLKYMQNNRDAARTVETFRVKRATVKTHLADSNARCIAGLVEVCKNIKHLDLNSIGLSQWGAKEIVRAVYQSKALETLDMSNNPGISPALSDGHLAKALRKNTSLTLLDITNDQLGSSAVGELHNAMKESHCSCNKPFQILDEGNNVFEEVLNALTHGVGVLFSIAGSCVLMYHASAEGQTRRTYYASLVYSLCLVILFLSSTLLHAVFLNPMASKVLGLMDHAAIYFLIAGTHLPFCVISLEDHPLGDTLAIAQWVLAVVGIVFCFVDSRMPIPYKMPLELTLYLSMGWMMGFVWEDAVTHISDDAVHLLAVGGGFYTVGVIFFVMEKTHHPIFHAIWHVFVLGGAVSHYFAVLLFVVGLEEEGKSSECIAHHLGN